jgi:hypothetical protein
MSTYSTCPVCDESFELSHRCATDTPQPYSDDPESKVNERISDLELILEYKDRLDMAKKLNAANELLRLRYDGIKELEAERDATLAANEILRVALEFYANVKRLMLEIDKLPTQDSFGMPMAYESMSVADNGDTAREALAKVAQMEAK